MRFVNIRIENFRNFQDLDVKLDNKNILFGLNDIGKTNFLCAIRFLLDRDYRRNGFVDSDYFQKNTDSPIIITLKIDISSDTEDDKKIRSKMKGSINSTADFVYIRLESNYINANLRGEPSLFWGSDITQLDDIPSNQAYFELDKLFNVIYIDSSIQLDSVFKRYTREIFRDEKCMTDYERKKIKGTIDRLNNSISSLSNIKKLQCDIKNEYKNYRKEKDLTIAIKSEIELENIHSKLMPYICYDELRTYPTSGDGRRKILSYTLLTMENRSVEEKMINIFLIEELENHLHRSMQIALSHQIFSEDIFKYLFLTTHSSLIVSQMDDVNLIKLFKKGKIDGKSCHYNVPKDYSSLKQKLNQNLADAIYANAVLLVEGPSERILFDRILKYKCNQYESLGGFILEVDGINFVEYYKILKELDIKIIVKTDNDLKLNEKKKEYNLLGLNRCLPLINIDKIENKKITDCAQFEKERSKIQIDIYDNLYKGFIDELRNNSIYLSRVDLENDLYTIIPSVMESLVKKHNTSKNPVEYMQSAKMINMIELCKLITNKDCELIYLSELFSCVKELVETCNL